MPLVSPGGQPGTVHLIDTHCHLDAEAFGCDREVVLRKAVAAGVKTIVVPAVKRAKWEPLVEFCGQHSGLHYALGLHPVYASAHENSDIDLLRNRLRQTQPVAVGEIGLDYWVRDGSRECQQRLFTAQLRLAQEFRLPVILHVRKAHDEVLNVLRAIRVVGGIVHAFNGSLQQADNYLSLDFKLGFGGMLTYERSTKLRRLARELPSAALVLETDAPDLTVVQHRGERNSPEYLPYCLAALAEVRGEEPEVVARTTTANAIEALRLPTAGA